MMTRPDCVYKVCYMGDDGNKKTFYTELWYPAQVIANANAPAKVFKGGVSDGRFCWVPVPEWETRGHDGP